MVFALFLRAIAVSPQAVNATHVALMDNQLVGLAIMSVSC